MSLPALKLLETPGTQVKRAVRRLRWFRRAFMEQIASVSRDCGIAFDVDTTRLAGAFLEWSAAFEAGKPAQEAQERAYVDFAAGMMFDHLLAHAPLSARTPGRDAAMTPVEFWPEAYACAVFCLNVRQAVLAQEYGEAAAESARMDDLRGWWSFRENLRETPRMAVAYLQHLAGGAPDWAEPGVFRAAPVAERPQLRLVAVNADHAPPEAGPQAMLPPGVDTVIFDLAAISNSRELVAQALEATIHFFGVAVAADHLRVLVDQPLAAAMTHVALETRRLCPGSFGRLFRERLAQRYASDLALLRGARAAISALAEGGIAVRIALVDAKAEVPELGSALGLDPRVTLVAPAEGWDLDDIPAQSCLLASGDAARLERAARRGIYGFVIGNAPGALPLTSFPVPMR